MSKLLPADQQRYNTTATAIDVDARRVTFADGSVIFYDALLSTMPLDTTLRWCGKGDWAAGLQHSSSHIIGLGLRGVSPHALKCWLYFPEDDCPFYRCVLKPPAPRGDGVGSSPTRDAWVGLTPQMQNTSSTVFEQSPKHGQLCNYSVHSSTATDRVTASRLMKMLKYSSTSE